VAQIQWAPGPAKPALAAETVDVWLADLVDGTARETTFEQLLSEEERARAARFVRPADGARWRTARGILRTLLGAYLDADPRALRFAPGPHGKPALAGGKERRAAAGSGAGAGDPSAGAANQTAERLRFNLSHSGDTALIAVAREREVGVDVELPRRAVDHVAIARRILGEAEAARLQALDPPLREREFLRAWVRWEAVLKCRGTGIGGADSVSGGPEPWIHELEIPLPGAAALAVADGPVAVRCWRWPPAEPGALRTISRP